MPRVLVKRALQEPLQGLEFTEVAKFRRTNGLFAQVVAQHELGTVSYTHLTLPTTPYV